MSPSSHFFLRGPGDSTVSATLVPSGYWSRLLTHTHYITITHPDHHTPFLFSSYLFTRSIFIFALHTTLDHIPGHIPSLRHNYHLIHPALCNHYLLMVARPSAHVQSAEDNPSLLQWSFDGDGIKCKERNFYFAGVGFSGAIQFTPTSKIRFPILAGFQTVQGSGCVWPCPRTTFLCTWYRVCRVT